MYIDDIILTTSNAKLCQNLLQLLHKKIDMHDLTPLLHFLDIYVHHTTNSMFLSQTQFAQDILSRRMTNCKPLKTLVNTKIKLEATTSLPIKNPTLYRQLTDAL